MARFRSLRTQISSTLWILVSSMWPSSRNAAIAPSEHGVENVGPIDMGRWKIEDTATAEQRLRSATLVLPAAYVRRISWATPSRHIDIEQQQDIAGTTTACNLPTTPPVITTTVPTHHTTTHPNTKQYSVRHPCVVINNTGYCWTDFCTVVNGNVVSCQHINSYTYKVTQPPPTGTNVWTNNGGFTTPPTGTAGTGGGPGGGGGNTGWTYWNWTYC